MVTIIIHPRRLIFALEERLPPEHPENSHQLFVWHDPANHRRTILESEVTNKSNLIWQLGGILARELDLFHKQRAKPNSYAARAMLGNKHVQPIRLEELLNENLIRQILTDLEQSSKADTFEYPERGL